MEIIDAFISRVVENILSPIVALLTILAFLYFVFGVVMYIKNADNEEARTTGQRHMLWAIVGLVLIFGVNAFIGLINGTVNSVLP